MDIPAAERIDALVLKQKSVFIVQHMCHTKQWNVKLVMKSDSLRSLSIQIAKDIVTYKHSAEKKEKKQFRTERTDKVRKTCQRVARLITVL